MVIELCSSLVLSYVFYVDVGCALFVFIALLMEDVENPDCTGLLQSWEFLLDFGR